MLVLVFLLFALGAFLILCCFLNDVLMDDKVSVAPPQRRSGESCSLSPLFRCPYDNVLPGLLQNSNPLCTQLVILG